MSARLAAWPLRRALRPRAQARGASLLGCVALVVALAVAGRAEALDAALARGQARLAAGDAAGALADVAQAEARDDLPAGDLLPLLALRAGAEAALGDAPALARTARTIVELAPSWQAPPDAPEALRAALDEARIAQPEPPELDVDIYPAQGGLRVVIEVDDDVSVVRGTRLAWRVAGERAWQHSEALEETVGGLPGTRVEYHVEALGPGGVVVAREGSARTPSQASIPAAPEGDVTGGLGTMTPASNNTSTTWLIAGGVTIAAVLVVFAVVVAGRSSDRTDLGVPLVEWP